MISFFANLFGYVLNFLYEFVGNYGLAIILFSILVKIIMLPISIQQQKTMQKSQKINDEMKQIQFKYKNDPETMNQEVMALYKREKMSPFSGCLSAIVQIILLFAVFYLVRSPLTYMKKVDSGVIEKLESIVQEKGSTSNYKEIAVINYINSLEAESGKSVSEEANQEQKENTTEAIEGNLAEENSQDETETSLEVEQNQDETISENSENQDNTQQENSEQYSQEIQNQEQIDIINEYKDQVYINMNFLGLDLSKVPTENLEDLKVLIIPALYVISSFISIKMSTNSTKKAKNNNLISDGKTEEKEDEYDAMAEANKSMSWMMPIMSISIACIAPLGLALYWLVNNILMIFERIILKKFIKDDNKEEAIKNA